MDSAPNLGDGYGQDVEPKGTYVLKKEHDVELGKPWVEGFAKINNPLIIPISDNTVLSYKYDLAKKYKAKGKGLTNKLMSLGYDAIITQYTDGGTGEIVLFPNCKFMLGMNETKLLIKKLLRESLNEERTLGQALDSKIKTPYITIYRACSMDANNFYDRDYVTLSKKFAIEHAENNHVYHEEQYHVIEALVSTSNVFDATNPSEYFYSGPTKKGREIYISKGPEEYEGYDESVGLTEEDDYKGPHQAPTSGGSPLYDLTEKLSDDVYSPACVRYYGHGHGAEDAFVCSIIKMARNKPDFKVKIYRAVPKNIDTINVGDWVTISPKYAKEHGENHVPNFKVLSKIVTAKDIKNDGDSIHEWGYNPL